MKTLLTLCGCLALLTACGQKGALYLPDKNASVVTRPAAQPAPAPAPQSTNTKDNDDDPAQKPKN
jgi:predicted small lipoprotein YifL